jgi:hypothetical protein
MTTSLPATTTDSGNGWDDMAAEAGERVLRGTLLKFSDWKWTSGKEGNGSRKAPAWSRST